MSIKRVCLTLAATALALGGCRAQQVGQANERVSSEPVVATISSEHRGGPSLFAGDRLAFIMLVSGAYGPTPLPEWGVPLDRYSLASPSVEPVVLATIPLY